MNQQGPMQRFYESYELPLNQAVLYRELVLLDNSELLEKLIRWKPRHVAITYINPLIDPDSIALLRSLLPLVTSSQSVKRYARIIILTADPNQYFEAVTSFLETESRYLLDEGRVFRAAIDGSVDKKSLLDQALGSATVVRVISELR